MLLLCGNIVARKLTRNREPQAQPMAFQKTRAVTKNYNILRLISCMALFALQIEFARKFGTFLDNGLCLLYVCSSRHLYELSHLSMRLGLLLSTLTSYRVTQS
jgi:hypothetical protein